ncbi:tetratricopeptide repeat protein [Streptomyces sp. NPDC051104]|uniref:tetratricopeptide repeat protein n=1 Tax=Streptomyces sp. NPDC051104 TaxID=3155044 RepID=UPI0034207CE0
MTDEISATAATALSLLESAQDGDPAAADRLGEILPSLTAAAESGDMGVQNVLGGILLEFAEHPADAAFWFKKTADRGSAVGKRSLGHLLANGLGVPQDLAEAERLFKEAADDGDAHAQFNLARLWWGKHDPHAVAALLRSAAAGGVDDAYGVLGDLLTAMGQSVEALKWYLKKIHAGDADGLHEAITLARGMTDEEIRRAGELAGCPGEAEAMVGTVHKYR